MAQQSTRGTSFFVRAAARATAVTALPMTIAGALYHRPQPDLEQEDWGGPMHYSPKPFTEEQRNSARWFSRQADNEQQKESLRLHEKLKHLAKPNSRSHEEGNNLMDRNIMFEEFQERILAQGHRIFQYIILGACNATIWIGMGGMYNSHEVLQDSHYHNFIQLVRRLKEQKIANSVARLGFSTTPCSNEEIDMAKKCTSPVALLTVSNHASTIDDPVLFGLLLPTDIKHDPDYIRWTLCSQEICFKKTALAAIFGAGKIMPIRRGGGIDQPLLLRFAQKIASGDWVHVFPEGKVVQSGQLGENYLGTRSVEDANEIGRLKWGVGKIIAHSPVDVHVIPIHHKGMEGVVPQASTGEIKQLHPEGGNYVKLRVGGRIQFDDLIDEHEKKYGALSKYSAEVNVPDEQQRWQSTNVERKLYSRITHRIEMALKQLEMNSRADPSMTSSYLSLVK